MIVEKSKSWLLVFSTLLAAATLVASDTYSAPNSTNSQRLQDINEDGGGRLDLTNHSLATVNANAFVDLANNLTELLLSSNEISTVNPSAFSGGLHNLTVLYLDNNRISWLDENTFTDLPSLAYLSLAGNRLTSLPDGIFKVYLYSPLLSNLKYESVKLI
jgi:Leucine-rich repeat (LRR) protein